MTFATTITRICAAHDNLSAAMNHYDSRNDLCLTIMDISEACNNLSTITDLYKPEDFTTPMIILARPINIPYDRIAIVRTAIQPAGTFTDLPAD